MTEQETKIGLGLWWVYKVSLPTETHPIGFSGIYLGPKHLNPATDGHNWSAALMLMPVCQPLQLFKLLT